MKIRERLMECKIKAKIQTDYKLAQLLDVKRQKINELMTGKCKPDAYIAIKISEVLGLHPMMLMAEFEGENAKDDKRKTFWLNFERRIKTGALGMLALISTAFWSPDAEAANLALDTHNVYSFRFTGGIMRVIILQL